MRCVRRTDLRPGQWDLFVDLHPDGWFFHREAWIAYCLAYRPGAIDHSFALMNDERPLGLVAVVPLIQEDDRFTMGDEPGASPLQLTGRVPADAVDAEIARHVEASGVRYAAFRPVPGATIPALGNGDWHPCGWTTTVLDLHTRDEDGLWRDLRKSYRYIIRHKRPSVVFSTNRPWAIPICRMLHEKAAGRITRSANTWACMAAWLDDGRGLVSLAKDTAGHWIGYAFAIRDKEAAYYASGATVADNVAHPLQWELIRALRCDGLRYYELGWNERPGRDVDPDKAAGIALFKRGFGGTAWPIAAVERRFDDALR